MTKHKRCNAVVYRRDTSLYWRQAPSSSIISEAISAGKVGLAGFVHSTPNLNARRKSDVPTPLR